MQKLFKCGQSFRIKHWEEARLFELLLVSFGCDASPLQSSPVGGQRRKAMLVPPPEPEFSKAESAH